VIFVTTPRVACDRAALLATSARIAVRERKLRYASRSGYGGGGESLALDEFRSKLSGAEADRRALAFLLLDVGNRDTINTPGARFPFRLGRNALLRIAVEMCAGTMRCAFSEETTPRL